MTVGKHADEFRARLKQAFKLLVLECDFAITKGWIIYGTEQPEIKGHGRFHREGRNILRGVVNCWNLVPESSMSTIMFVYGHQRHELHVYESWGPWGYVAASRKEKLEWVLTTLNLPHSTVREICMVGEEVVECK